VTLSTMAYLYRIARDGLNRASLGHRDMFDVNCVNVVKVAATGGAGAVKDARLTILRLNEHGAYMVAEDKAVEHAEEHNLDATTYVQDSLEALTKVVDVAELDNMAAIDEPYRDKPMPLVIISDPGQDQDDEIALVLSRTLSDIGLIDVRCVVANLKPSDARAKLAAGTLKVLNMPKVPVGIGTDGNSDKHVDNFTKSVEETGHNYMDREVVDEGDELLVRTYNAAEPHSLILLLISSLTDAAAFIRNNEALFLAKTNRVAIMGGVDAKSLEDDEEFLLPDQSAQNHKFDEDAADFVFRKCQELGVRLVVLARSAAYAASVPAFIYDELATIGHPIALRLRNSQLKAISGLWARASLPHGDPDRLGLPDRCDRDWFSSTFCDGADLGSVDANTPIWPFVASFNMYDPLTLLAAHPSTLQKFFEPTVKVVNGVSHLVVGVDAEVTGVKDKQSLRAFMMNALRYALSQSVKHALGSTERKKSIALRRLSFSAGPGAIGTL